ncbi:hypothetical protein DER45DRAFT_546253 [Fusarium avenaceum]|nr:hypothetical protein DER45DRAFT_546253 [Fusarium avenaceum]
MSLAVFRHLILTLFGIVVSLEYWKLYVPIVGVQNFRRLECLLKFIDTNHEKLFYFIFSNIIFDKIIYTRY